MKKNVLFDVVYIASTFMVLLLFFVAAMSTTMADYGFAAPSTQCQKTGSIHTTCAGTCPTEETCQPTEKTPEGYIIACGCK